MRLSPEALVRATALASASILLFGPAAATRLPDASVRVERAQAVLWVADGGLKPEARRAADILRAADDDGLDPADYADAVHAVMVALAIPGPAELARAEAALSRAWPAYIADLRRAPPEAQMTYTDPQVAPPPPEAHRLLLELANTSDLAAGLERQRRMNPIYEELRAALVAHRAGRSRRAADARERLILANLERARALPAEFGDRYVLVDAAAGRLQLVENGEVADVMDVVVGRPDAPTPVMAGVIRYAAFNPYWNLPVDIVQREIAPQVLREGTGFLEARNMEALSDWSEEARVLDLAEVDWAGVAAGRQALRLRQRPGPDNILGKVKLMLPNRLGIYLHDTPDKSAFARSRRTLSAGCIRLEDAMRLTRRLLGPALTGEPPGGLEARVDLPEPIPVFIVYFTLAPEGGKLARRPDIYGRDDALLASLEARRRA